MQRTLSKATTSFLLIVAADQVPAALFDVDPGPYNPDIGSFAAWYQDTHGRTLDLCLSKAVSSRAPGAPGAPGYMCSLLPEPGVYDDAQPLVFPTNFPPEAFWFTADAAIADAASGINLDWGSAIEAAFAVETPAEGDQISFARIRIRVDVPTIGTYTITHPYGVEVFEVTAAEFGADGGRAINMTRDIGIGAPKTYNGALGGDIGPFLRSVNGPYTEVNPETTLSERFIGDPNLNEPVTGSPFNTNYVRIQGPGGIDLRTNLFAVSGKLSEVVRPTPVIVQRSTYSRSAGEAGASAQQDVFVMAPPPPGTADYEDSAGDAVAMTEANATGNWYGQSTGNPTLPASVTINADNSVAIPESTPTTLSAPLVDIVRIERAEYNLNSGELTVVASSSDETSPPELTATTSSGAAIGTLSGDGATKSLTTGITPTPPAKVTVTSLSGGSDTEEVVILP
ncbi:MULTISPECIES: hypothetical protein [unclassified Pseudomonas]|uniref:hypothetical protein n=1 Tax=unclassified Pseudomonas TaxID=196821 RepID=UPI00129EF607|nr:MULTISPECIES: hypothetical protein [unclassified Pseudomonas]MDH4652090.1 hypothetical protein [Pseudomonas sp. BN606]MRK22559.1 hypothetical protein [Pseudomonas sp. JG-B]